MIQTDDFDTHAGLVDLVEAALLEPHDPLGSGPLSPSAIFDSLAPFEPPATDQWYDALFEVVARPGESIAGRVRRGDLLVLRDAADGAGARIGVIGQDGVRSLEERSYDAHSGEAAGWYVQVLDRADHSLDTGEYSDRRLSGPDLRLRTDALLLRLRIPRAPVAEPEEVGGDSGGTPEMDASTTPMQLLSEATTYPTVHGFDVPATYYMRGVVLSTDTPSQVRARTATDPPEYAIARTNYDTVARLRAASPKIFKVGGTPPAGRVVVIETNRGEALFRSGHVRAVSGAPTAYEVRLDARIHYPADPADQDRLAGRGRFPVLVIVHGNHAALGYDLTPAPGGVGSDAVAADGTPVRIVEGAATLAKEIPNHKGYRYLQDELARHGIVSVSISTNVANFLGSLVKTRAEMVLGALEYLRVQDGDSASRFHDRLDLQCVGLVGHSRGGDAVIAAAELNHPPSVGSRFGIRAVVSLAPTDATGLTRSTSRATMAARLGALYLVMYGSHDGDVAPQDPAWGFTGTGFRHYDRAGVQRAMVFVERASHNRFNTVWVDPSEHLPGADADTMSRLRDGADPSHDAAEIAALRDTATHQSLAREYIGGWLRFALLNDWRMQRRFDGTTANSSAAPVSLQWKFGRRVTTIDDFHDASATTSRIGGAITGIAAASELEIAAEDPARFPHVDRVLKANAAPSQVTFQIPVAERDFSDYSALTMRVVKRISVASEAAIRATPFPPRIRITLTDGSGAKARVTEAAITAENRLMVRPFFRESSGTNLTVLSMQTLRLPLSRFAGISLRDTHSVRFEVVASSTEPVYLDTIALVKQ